MMLKETFDLSDPTAHEDDGLFRGNMTQACFQVLPKFGTNRRNDVIIAARLDDETPVQIVIAGRRAAGARALKAELTQAWRLAVQSADKRGVARPNTSDVRLRGRFEGVWRTVFDRDEHGCESRSYQFIAARWTYVSFSGDIEVGGEPRRTGQDVSFTKPAVQVQVSQSSL